MGRYYFAFATATTPHGLPGDLMRKISFSVAKINHRYVVRRGPFAENKYFPSGESAIPHGRVPTLMVFSTSISVPRPPRTPFRTPGGCLA